LKRALRLTVIALLTILFLGLFLWNSNLHDVWSIIRGTSMPWFVGGLAVNFAALLLRTVRWRKLLGDENAPGFYPTFFANTVGYMLSTVLPVRAGDVARPALISRRTNVRFTEALGTVLTERILDLYGLMILFIYYVVRHWNSYGGSRAFLLIKSGAIGGAATLAALTFFMAGMLMFRSVIRRLHEWVGKAVPQRFRESWMRFFDAFAESLQLTRRPGALLTVVGATAGIWLCLTGQFWFIVVAMRRPLPFDASFFICGLSTIGMIVPTPGGVGGFHKACQMILTTFYGFDIDSSVAAALLFHVVGTLPVVATGLILFAHQGMRWKDVVKTADSEAGQQTAGDE